MDISAFSPAEPNLQISYQFKNMDIIGSNCKYISGLTPSDNNDTPLFTSSTSSNLTETKSLPKDFIGIHVTNFVPSVPNNASYPSTNNAYRSSDLYIYNNRSANTNGITHKLKDITVLGEVVIKHNPVISGKPTMYLCFILAEQNQENTEPNEIDKIINFVGNTTASANVLSTSIGYSIPPQTMAGVYLDKYGSVVIVFNQPILINSKSKEMLNKFDSTGPNDAKSLPVWLNNNPSGALLLSSNNIKTTDEENVYMECIPTGISKEDIKAYTVPINSQYTEDASKIEFMSSTVRFTFLVFFVLILYALFPTLWSTIYKIINPSETAAAETDNMRLELDAVEFWYYVYLFCIFAVTFSLGLAFNFDSTHISIAFLIIFTLALTSTMILFNRTAKDPTHYLFKETFKEGFPEINNYFSSLAPISNNPDINPWIDTLKFWKRPGLWGWLFLVLTIVANLIIIVIQHKGQIPTSINSDPTNVSTDPNVMNVLELLDCIFGSIFALIAIRVGYKIYIALQQQQ